MKLLLVALGICSLALPCFAQHDQHFAVQAASVSPIVDGSQHPELIGDAAAVKAFLVSAAYGLRSSGGDDRLAAQISRIGLDTADVVRLRAAIKSYSDILETSLKARNAAAQDAKTGLLDPVIATATFVSLSKQLDSDTDSAWQAILGTISEAGATKLAAHIAYVKTKMKIVPPPQM